jgi:chromosome segregation ATPase
MSDESVTKTQQAFESLLSAIETNTKAQKDTMTAMMKDIVDSTSDATRGIVKDVGSIAEQNRNLMGDFAILTDSAKASVTKYQEVVKSTTNLIVTASSVTDSVSQNLTKLATLESNMQDLTAKFMAESRSLLDIQQRNASGVERYQQVFKEVEAGLATVLRQISENMSRYNDLTKTGLEGYLKQYDESLSKATSKLSTTVKDLDDALDGLAETLSKGPSA